MYCRNCGKQSEGNSSFCSVCGGSPNIGTHYCPSCGVVTNPNQAACVKCGVSLAQMIPGEMELKSKLAAGLLGVFLGAFGVHRFYLGYTTIGLIQLILTLLTCGISSWWGFIEGILILTGSINTDADGRPLKD